MIYGIIYKVTFPNEKVYIGQTKKTLEQRKNQHFRYLNKKKPSNRNYVLYRAFEKYGFNNTKWEIIDNAENEKELNEKEKYWINYYKSYVKFAETNGYNLTLGGDSVERFTVLNDKDLYNCGLEIKQGKPKKYIMEKYNLSKSNYRDISKGLKWSYYTKIAPVDYNIEEYNTTITKFQVDKVIELFKKYGDCKIIAKELGICKNLVTNIVMGRSWSKYTGILDETTFYRKYNKTETKYKEDIPKMIQLRKEGKTTKEISNILDINISTVQGILSGKTLSHITNIKHKTFDELKDKGELGGATLKKEQVLEIVEKNQKGETIKNLAKEYGVQTGAIYNILNGLTWNNITKIKRITKEEKLQNAPISSKLTKEQVFEIIELHENGMSNKEISYKYSVKKETISAIVTGRTWSKYTNINRKDHTKKTISKDNIDKVIKLNKEGMKQKDIADLLDVSKNVINDILTGKRWSSYTGIEYKPKRRNKK